jgi:hypothetical protein
MLHTLQQLSRPQQPSRMHQLSRLRQLSRLHQSMVRLHQPMALQQVGLKVMW